MAARAVNRRHRLARTLRKAASFLSTLRVRWITVRASAGISAITLALAVQAAVGSAGQIAFVSDRGGTDQVHIMNADGSGVRKLTRIMGEHTIDDLAWSPDGTQLLFTVWPNIHVINADGTGLRAVVRGTVPPMGAQWSPDGSRICYASTEPKYIGPGDLQEAETGIFVVNRDGSGLKAVVPIHKSRYCLSPSWSPDGSRIAFVAGGGRESLAIRSIGWDGGAETVLTDLPTDIWGFEVNARWSPRGQCIAYCYLSDRHEGGLGLLSIDLGSTPATRTLIADGVGRWAWSPDGKMIAYERWDGDACPVGIIDVETRRTRRLSQYPLDCWRDPQWSPDGSRIAFVVEVEGTGGSDIYAVNADGSAEVNLTRDWKHSNFMPRWRP